MEKSVHGRRGVAHVPIEQLTRLNPKGSTKEITFDGVANKEDLFSTLDLAVAVRGSQKPFPSRELRDRFEKIAAFKKEGNDEAVEEQLKFVTNGQAGQNLRDAFKRVLVKIGGLS